MKKNLMTLHDMVKVHFILEWLDNKNFKIWNNYMMGNLIFF